ncbi:hypothetical protein [Alicyclobacillus fodiniaquatilis]|uniref:Uncharacterized protein n=1 Tax=Alicyclobacillus fodiniaquatilis TaxID=1661150 RepID=A0ABW4JEK2_9BACL
MRDERNFDVEEIQTKRINIVDENGTRRLAIFNGSGLPKGTIDGKEIDQREGNNNGVAGLMFYNQDGDECGALVYGNQGAALLFDQYKQDQIVGMTYDEENGKRQYGLNIWERPNVPLSEFAELVIPIMNMEDGPEKQEEWRKLEEQGLTASQRMFTGRTQDGAITVALADKKGKTRLRMTVDMSDNPKIEFLNSQGQVVYQLPPDGVEMD